jgi:transcription elongation factor Elf1
VFETKLHIKSHRKLPLRIQINIADLIPGKQKCDECEKRDNRREDKIPEKIDCFSALKDALDTGRYPFINACAHRFSWIKNRSSNLSAYTSRSFHHI